MPLNPEACRQLARDGYLRLPGAVPVAAVEEALRAINRALSHGMDPSLMWQYHAQSFVPELRRSPAITNLYADSTARPALEAMLGAGTIEPVVDGQIALRFPTETERPMPRMGHIDGLADPRGHNGVPVGTIDSFTALVGVLLSDCPAAGVGNFTVWPGTHRAHAAYLAAHGAQALLQGLPPIPQPAAVPIVGRAGDAVLAHYLLGHGVGPHHGPHIRYMVFFRIRTVGHAARQAAALSDCFLEWPGLAGHTPEQPVAAIPPLRG